MTQVTVAEAAILTGKSKRLIYNLINDRKLPTQDSTAGALVSLERLQQILANRRGPGRPRKDAA